MDKGKVSIIVPSRNELFLNQTVDDLFNKAQGEIEVIVILEGYWPNPPLKDRNNLIIIHRGQPLGLRAANNTGVSIAKGEYIMKCDAHCLFDNGYDKKLKQDCDDNWIVIPGRHSLDPENWCIQQNGKSRRDYHYLCFPNPIKEHDHGMHGVEWPERSRERSNNPEYNIDDTPSFQGSCWFMKKSWYTDHLGDMDETGVGGFSQEPQELGNKTWLMGGAIKVNKNTFYAHLHKGRVFGRMYHINQQEIINGHNYSAWYWMNNSWKKQIHPFSWLIEKFWPMPTWDESWHLDWNKSFEEWKVEYAKYM